MNDNLPRRGQLQLVLIAIGLAALVGFGLFLLFAPDREIEPGMTEEHHQGGYSGETPAMQRLVVTNWEFDPEASTISGSVENNTDHPFLQVEVSFNLYDERGEHIGVASEIREGLFSPRQLWPFTIEVAETGVSRVDLNNVTGLSPA